MHREPLARQQGVVLMVALIVLVAMTLAGIALMRSVDTTTLIAGNLGFQQSAMRSGDIGTESAITWLQNNNDGSTLNTNNPGAGYFADGLQPTPPGTVDNPMPGQTWDNFWTNSLDPNGLSTSNAHVSNAQNSGNVWTLATDPVTGNTVSYVIHRLCVKPVAPTAVGSGCAVSQASVVSTGSSKGTGVIGLQYASQYYYRITSRITGPRNTVSYIQTIIAL
jgi:type IV pilus assembly protein PilX